MKVETKLDEEVRLGDLEPGQVVYKVAMPSRWHILTDKTSPGAKRKPLLVGLADGIGSYWDENEFVVVVKDAVASREGG